MLENTPCTDQLNTFAQYSLLCGTLNTEHYPLAEVTEVVAHYILNVKFQGLCRLFPPELESIVYRFSVVQR